MRLVSVVCPVHDTDRAMLDAAVASVLSQDAAAVVEVVLVDDCSTAPATLAALADLATDARVRLVRNRRNLGPAGSRNAGIQAASGDWIGFLDADDLWPAGSLAARLDAPAEQGDCVLAAFEELLDDGSTRAAVPLALGSGQDLGGGWVLCQQPHATPALIDTWRHIGGLFVSRAALQRAGLFDAALTYGEDWLLVVRLSLSCRMVLTERPLYVLRRQHVSMMGRRARLTRAFSRANEVAFTDPALRDYRKHLRWALIRQYKGMAVNSLANNRPVNALRYALLAYRHDPRELRPLMMFLRAAGARDGLRQRDLSIRYSRAVITPGLV